jgi:uncharacterized protein YqjF (DUF2071 family)
MVNFTVSRADLLPHLPSGTEIDDWQGNALASVVAFQFLNARVRGVAVPLHRNFEEMNLRFYVRRETDDGIRRGVVFLREIVPLPLVALVARLIYNEPYRTLPMRSSIETGTAPGVRYSWRAGGKWHWCGARGSLPGSIPLAGTLEEFVTEHYWGYGRRKNGETLEYQVIHPRWTVWTSTSLEMDGDFGAAFGPDWTRRLGEPTSIFIADGSEVTVSPAGPLLHRF